MLIVIYSGQTQNRKLNAQEGSRRDCLCDKPNILSQGIYDIDHLQKAVHIGLNKVCHQHCRALASIQGLKTLKLKEVLVYQLTLISKEGNSTGVCHNYSNWFTVKYQEE